MADLIRLMRQPVRLTAAAKQDLYLVLDVSRYEILDLQLVCLVEGSNPGGGGVEIKILSSMQDQSEDGWLETPANFAGITTAGTPQVSNCTITSGLFKFLRWQLKSMGTSPAATAVSFFIEGMARQYL